jgi:FdhD protein
MRISGMLLLSSRVSVEMVQKAATLGVDVDAAAGITLIGVARSDGFEVFTYPDRINLRKNAHVA